MAQKKDQIFQLSLTEIAFCITFILLLLLGYQVINEQIARKAAEEKLSQLRSVEETTKLLEGARAALAAEVKATGAASPDDIITKLAEAQKLRDERDHLRKQVEDLDAKLTALTELRNLLEQTSGDKSETLKAEVAKALALQSAVRDELGNSEPIRTKDGSSAEKPPTSSLDRVKQAIATSKTLRAELKSKLGLEPSPVDEARTVVDIVDAAKSFAELSKGSSNARILGKENSDLRGQVAFLKKRLDARGGRDYPPCWADETGKVEFLFSIELRSDAIVITPAWPARREADARSLPGISAALAEAHSYSRFASAVQGIVNSAKSQDPECRHYVQLKSSISDAVQSDRARLVVESYFYKVEVRR